MMHDTIPAADAAPLLLEWYDRHHRDLPWRVSPPMASQGIVADPYHVWLSEVMLQQTTVQAVKAYFVKFLSLWPTVEDLARADNEDVMKAWAGLGYYARARNLKKCAEVIARDHGGRFPDTEDGLKSLPGIGDYTAAAIAAIAFNRNSAVLDGNVERVISRLYAIETPLPAAKPEMRARVAILTPDDRPGDFAQAMMDLGATICTPKRPACSLCPFRAHCRALVVADPETFPRKAQKKDKPLRRGAAFVAIDADNAVYLRKRIETGLLGGMTEVPGTDWTSRQDGDTTLASQPFAASWEDCGTISHVFTHFELRLSVYRAKVARAGTEGNGWWEPVHSLKAQALPTVMKKAIAQAIPHAFKTER
ncbi:A/G-specific adenine glycosylase [Ensifer adhaerens]|nr:A/G-specific adenine glycosylase [Ensifer adhaerens]MBZ7920763.1 A/G-specific adenine glycosylase [Ensifer adhaerens]UAX94594.1 A/G-specific adenine glycosylase [Ensifer adhaerens]UAY02228.1 A/G-specific adenine glycosylase [Ensifer adhaerens]UAY09612.1 A/G-specific adenine glycosylase [Ensifer adhaerens]